MRHVSLAVITAASIFTVAIAAPAAAGRFQRPHFQQDTYCLQGRSYGYPGNCQFSTYEQCLATASGTDSRCGINPMRAYAADPRGGGYARY